MANEAYSGPRPPADFNPRTDPPLDFADRPMAEMRAEDYRTLGFMCGLEVHQQLATHRKLFCRCPADRRTDVSDASVLRQMRPTLSELGEYDGTALMEFKTRKDIIYLLERGSVCTYEMDDTPPFEISDEAVQIGLEVAMMFGLKLVSELHVMRKQYLDGSIPTGFQRTAMLGLDGVIPFRVPELGVDRELRIRQLSLEEDSCREVSDVGHVITFRTDRLGVPLTETVTEPELLTPHEVQAGGRLIARYAQATGRVRRGMGAARQDVNVSVAGGRRIELKGVGSHRVLPLLVHVEAFRQLNLLRIREELRRRGVEPGHLTVPPRGDPWAVSELVRDAGPILRRTSFEPIQEAFQRGERVVAVRLPGFGGLLGARTQPGITFARELADRVRVIACLQASPFLLHSDVDDFGIEPSLWKRIRKRVRSESGDAVVVVWGPGDDAATAAREILIRAGEAVVGVPAETRQALPDGTTGFERILPGPDRMYPDTDTPPIPVRDQTVAEIGARLRERPSDRQRRYEDMGLGADVASRLAAAPWAGLFDELDPEDGAVARRLALSLEKRIPCLRRSGRIDGLPTGGRIRSLVRAMESCEIRLEATERALDTLLVEPVRTPDEILAPYRAAPRPEELEVLLASAVEGLEGMESRGRETRLRHAMGIVMPPLLGRMDPAEVRAAILNRLARTEDS